MTWSELFERLLKRVFQLIALLAAFILGAAIWAKHDFAESKHVFEGRTAPKGGAAPPAAAL